MSKGRAGAGGSEAIQRRRGDKRFSFVGWFVASLCLLCFSAASASAVSPTVVSTNVTEVTTESATLKAEVDPEGNTAQARFEYGLGDCATTQCTKTANVPIGSGTVPVPILVKLSGLTPGGNYHFRVVAPSTPGGTGLSPDQTFGPYALAPIFPPCPNDAFRTSPPQPSAALGDCRAYEQASPVAKNAVDARGRVSFAKASPSGDRVSFVSAGGIPGAEGSQGMPVYLSSRANGNWSTQGLLPSANTGEEAFVLGWTPDFAHVFDAVRKLSGAGGGSFLSRPSGGGLPTTIVPYNGGLKNDPPFAGTSDDGVEVLFESNAKLASTPEAIEGKPNLYIWDRDTGVVRLAGAFNGDPAPTAPPAGAFAGAYDWMGQPGPASLEKGGAAIKSYTQDQHVISSDGSRVYFTAGKTGQLYMRLNPTQKQSPLDVDGQCTDPTLACTIHVSASQKTNGTGLGDADPAGTRPAAFMGASADGKAVFFTSSEKLTNDANTGPELLPPAVARSNLDGSAKNLSFVPAKAKGVAVDSEYIYWADPEDGTIGRAELDGTPASVKAEFITGLGKPQYVAVDGEHIYWTNAADGADTHGTIGWAKLDGTSVEPSLITGASNPQGIDVDAEHIYWGNGGSKLETRTIGRSDLVGTPASVDEKFVEVDFGTQQIVPQGLAVDATHIYLATIATQESTLIIRYDISGEKASQKFLFPGTGAEPRGITLDAGHVYVAMQGTGTIGQAKLDLSEPKLEFIKEADRPTGLAVDAGHLYWSANQEAPPNPGNDLYRYEYDPATGGGNLSDLAVGANTNGAQVRGLLGTSADGSSVYFAGNGDLDGAGPAQAGDCEAEASQNSLSSSGQCNLYLAREGSPAAFVAPLDASAAGGTDAFDWLPRGLEGQQQKTARVSANGTLLFRSKNRLTPYDNKGTPELYRYRPGEGIDCVSCNPTGQAPTGAPKLGSITLSNEVPPDLSYVLSRNISADGNRAFFETTDALVIADTNGVGGCPEIGPAQGKYPVCLDVYEWEAKGTGGCKSESQDGGCIYLLSSGKSTDASYFADASASGDDAFLITRDPFVRQDQDQLYDVYDAHVNGGLASQNEVKVICEAEGCKHPASPQPAFQTPGTNGFSGPSDPKPKRAKKKHGHKKAKKAHHKKHGKRAAKTTGRANR